MSGARTSVLVWDQVWCLTLWALACIALGLLAGSPVAGLGLALAAVAMWRPRDVGVRALVGALQGLGLSLIALQAPALAVAILTLLAAGWGAWRVPRALLFGLIGALCLGVPAVLSMSAGRGDPVSAELYARLASAVVMVAISVSGQTLTAWRHGWDCVVGSAAVAVLVTIRVLMLAGGEPLLLAESPRHSALSLEAAKVGSPEHLALQLRQDMCVALTRGDRDQAVRIARWGMLLAPRYFGRADVRLWRAELVAEYDLRQAREIALRALSRTSADAVGAALRGREQLFALQVRDWAEQQHGESRPAARLEHDVPSLEPGGECFACCPRAGAQDAVAP